MRDLTELIQNLTENSFLKRLAIVGGQDDALLIALSPLFKSTHAYSDDARIAPYEDPEKGIAFYQMPTREVIDQLSRYDVILFERSIHRLTDLEQLWVYDKIGHYQELYIVEWDFTGSLDAFTRAFMDITPLCTLARGILNRFVSDGRIEIESAAKGRTNVHVHTRQDLVSYYKYVMPNYFNYGEKDFLRRLGGLPLPITLWEGFDLFKIQKAEPRS